MLRALHRTLAAIAAAVLFVAPAAAQRFDPGPPRDVAPGVALYHLTDQSLLDPPGPVSIWLLRLDPSRIRLRSSLANDEILGTETVAGIAERHRALAAINAGFFLPNGDPAGALTLDGQLVSDASRPRGAVGIQDSTSGTSLIFARLRATIALQIGPRTSNPVPIDGVDTTRARGKLMLFTPAYHTDTDTAAGGREWVIDGRPLRVKGPSRVTGKTPIPPRGYVLSYGGTTTPEPLRRLRNGTPVTLTTSYQPVEGPSDVWQQARDIVGGAGLLLRDGRAIDDWTIEQFAKGFAETRHPRTMIGAALDGTIWLVTVDGRQPQLSVGMTLVELRALASRLELVNALNLDGGGSTTMWVGGEVKNSPSDATGPRKVSDALLVFTADTPGRSTVTYRFGPFTLDPASYRLLKDGDVVALSPKIIDLLLYLVARPSALATKEELFKALWPDVAVTDNALTQAVSELRQALGDSSSKPVYVQTVARRGYRFIASVNAAAPVPAVTPAAVSEPVVATQPAIAVLDFSNVSGDREVAWLSSGIAETVTNDLRATSSLRVIDRLRVVEAVRRSGSDLAALRAELHLDRAVVGSFQRAGTRLRITARVVDAATGEAVAEAKADGPIEKVFELQDRIVAQFTETLGMSKPDTGSRRSVGDTSSLEAYQAFTEGRVRLESLDASLVPAAIADFERAVSLDPRYASAHVGLANARFWQYEMSRARNQPEGELLARAIDHVRRAIELERDLAEAHATLAFLLMSARRAEEALTEARRAVALEPGYWGNQFRLAHAAWGDERLQALARAVDLYPDFPFIHFEAAMVHIARGDLDRAELVLREGTIVQDRQAHLKQRYPAKGLHWLLGLVRLARGDAAEAHLAFEREVRSGPGQLYAAEFAMNAYDGAGFACLSTGDSPAAVASFRRALELFPEHARTLVGLGAALNTGGDQAGAAEAFVRATAAIDALRRGSRGSEATLAEALHHAVRGREEESIQALTLLLDRADLPFTGWTIPIEPLLAEVRRNSAYSQIATRLADRAR